MARDGQHPGPLENFIKLRFSKDIHHCEKEKNLWRSFLVFLPSFSEKLKKTEIGSKAKQRPPAQDTAIAEPTTRRRAALQVEDGAKVTRLFKIKF